MMCPGEISDEDAWQDSEMYADPPADLPFPDEEEIEAAFYMRRVENNEL